MRPLAPERYRHVVASALAEDLGAGDVTTEATVPPDQQARGVFLAKEECVIAGLDVAAEAFRQLEPGVHVTFDCRDGDRVARGTEIGSIRGLARTLLAGE